MGCTRIIDLVPRLWGLVGCAVLVVLLAPGVVQCREISVRDVSFANAERQVLMHRFAPADRAAHPAILLLHGRSGYEMRRPFYEGYALDLAEQGFEVYALMYYDKADERAMSARGLSTHRETYHRRLSNWIAVVNQAVGYIAKEPSTDPRRIGVLGFSQGAFIAVAAAGLNPSIGAVVEVYGGMPQEVRDRIESLPPTLILHGDADTSVPVGEAYALEAFLRRHSVKYEIRIYPGARHGFDSKQEDSNAQDARKRTLDFFNAELAGATPRALSSPNGPLHDPKNGA